MHSLLSPQLEAFAAVAKHKSMHSGAKALHLTQTAVTQRIQTLEKRLCTTLFIRTRHGVQLTPEGEALLRYYYTVSDLSGETLSQIRDAAIETQIRICITGPSSIMASRIVPQCRSVMRRFPELLMTFDINDGDHRLQSLRTGINQLAILEPEKIPREVTSKPLAPEKYLLVCCPHWKKRSLTEILREERIIDFDEEDNMTLNYLKQYKLCKLTRSERLFISRTEPLANMIAEGYGYGVLTEEFCKPYLDKKQLILLNDGKKFHNHLALAWYARSQPPKYLASLIKAIC